MSYLVLARKYRPTTFDEIIGQEHVTRTLANAFAKDRVHHAFLFCGPRGVGKTTAARVLARALCCERGPTPTPCGVCEPCRSILAGTATDFLEIDGASNNSVEDVRELRDGVRYQPAHLRRKIYVIDEVHMLSTSAFNALLKTLEEPPPHVTFVFATTEVHKIPVTILSRCQRYDFKLVTQAQLAAHLGTIFEREGLAADRGALVLLAREAGGSVRDMLSLADQVIAYAGSEKLTEARVAEVLGVADRALLHEMAAAVTGGDPKRALLAVEAGLDRGVDVGHLARSFLGMLRDLSVVQSVPDASGLVDATPEELTTLKSLARAVTSTQLHYLFHRWAQACEQLSESPSPRLVVEVTLLELAGTPALEPIAGLVDRLEGLERRMLRGGGGGGGGEASGGGGERPRTNTMEGRAPVAEDGARDVPGPRPPTSPQQTQTQTQAQPLGRAPTFPPAPNPSPSAAPTAVVAAPPTRLSPHGDPLEQWERTIDQIERKSATLAGVYAHARVLSWQPGVVTLGFARGSFHARLGAETENVRRLEAILAELTGGPVKVVLEQVDSVAAAPDTPNPGSVVEREQVRRREDTSRREEEARSHPVTRKVLEVFDNARIQDIKIDE